MKCLEKNSLFQTVDNVSEALLFGFKISDKEKNQIADFIVSRQVNEAYADTFAPTEADSKQDLILFTGERIKSGAGKYHMIGEEASRVLRKLALNKDHVHNALTRADNGMKKYIEKEFTSSRYDYGMYCCKSCSCALWINLSSGGINYDMNMLKAGMEYLKKYRDSKGSWKGFPNYYTLYVLNEIDFELSKDELTYAAPSIERKIKRKKTNETKYDLRRKHICQQILNKINTN